MLEQHAHEAHSEWAAGITPPEATLLSPLLTAQIEDYLDRRFAPLIGSVPYVERQRRRIELRDHLYAAVRAHMELGSPADEAVSAALRHVGDLRRTARAGLEETRLQPSARRATILSTILFGLPWLADNRRLAGQLWGSLFGGPGADPAFYRTELFLVPLIAGLLVALLARQRPVRGVLNGLALLTIPAIIVPAFVFGLAYAGFISQNARLNWLPDPVPGVIGLPYWAGLGCAGAWIGAWIKRHAPRALSAPRIAC